MESTIRLFSDDCVKHGKIAERPGQAGGVGG